MCGFRFLLFTFSGLEPLSFLLVSDCCRQSIKDCRFAGGLGC
jgi:hypothetical protein